VKTDAIAKMSETPLKKRRRLDMLIAIMRAFPWLREPAKGCVRTHQKRKRCLVFHRYQSACTFCFRVETRRYVIPLLSTEQAEWKFSQTSDKTSRFACADSAKGEAKAAVISSKSRVLLFPGKVMQGSRVRVMIESVHCVWQSWRLNRIRYD